MKTRSQKVAFPSIVEDVESEAMESLDGPESDSARALVLFHSTRSRVTRVRVGDLSFDPIPSLQGRVWISSAPLVRGEPLHVSYEYEGEMPTIREALPEGRLRPEQALSEARTTDLCDRLRAIEKSGKYREHRLRVLAYDALTDPIILQLIQEGEIDPCGSLAVLLGHLDKTLEFPRSHYGSVEFMQNELFARVQDRGRSLLRRDPIARIEAATLVTPSYDDVIDSLSEFHASLFPRLFPGFSSTGVGEAFRETWTLFANGDLAILRSELDQDEASPATGPPKGRKKRETPVDYNARPDSILFFCFAEFFLEADRRQTEQLGAMEAPQPWLECAAVFIEIQDLFMHRFGPRCGPFGAGSYDQINPHFDSEDGLTREQIATLRAHSDLIELTRENLEKRHTANIAVALRDDEGVADYTRQEE